MGDITAIIYKTGKITTPHYMWLHNITKELELQKRALLITLAWMGRKVHAYKAFAFPQKK
ncbi:MAG TPA: hypothetical protein DCZ00_04145 [Lactococcus sp.]|nr:hypothetical protein [Lactococcus sp.]